MVTFKRKSKRTLHKSVMSFDLGRNGGKTDFGVFLRDAFKKKKKKLDRGSIRSSPRNGIGSIYNKNLECWSQVGHLLDTLRY